MDLKVPVRSGIKFEDVLKPFEDASMSSFKVFINGELVDRKKKI